MKGDIIEQISIDSNGEADDAIKFPVEFLNSINLPGIPSHKLELKIGCPIILLRNIRQPILMNGTRLIVTKVFKNLIVARIITGPFKG